MAVAMPAFRAFGAHELPVASADDPAVRQQKMMQQRQLALKRQRDMAKANFGVVAQLDSPVKDGQSKMPGWGKFLQGLDGAAEKLDVEALKVCMVVPPAGDEEVVKPTSLPTPKSAKIEAVAQDLAQDMMSEMPEPTEDATPEQLYPHLFAYEKIFAAEKKVLTPQLSAVDNCWDLQSQAEQEVPDYRKGANRKFWRPWGASKRNSDSPARSKVTIISDKAHAPPRCATPLISRAATPWQAFSEEGILEASFESDISSMPGFMTAEDPPAEVTPHGASPTPMLKALNEQEEEHDDDGDSGIDSAVNQWQQQEKQSPEQKRGRFSRFIPSVPAAPKLWRASRKEIITSPLGSPSKGGSDNTSVTHTPVTPMSIELE